MPVVHNREEQRFWSKVRKTASCWLWMDNRAGGYGRLKIWRNGDWRQGYAHIISYELAKGPKKQGTDIDHLCRNTFCVNPEHLEMVSRRTNWIRSRAKNAIFQTGVCYKGHKLAETGIVFTGGQKYCKACKQERARRYADLS